MDRLLSIEELATYLGVAPHTIYQRRYRGDALPRSVKLGGRVRYRQSDVEAFLDAHTEGAKQGNGEGAVA